MEELQEDLKNLSQVIKDTLLKLGVFREAIPEAERHLSYAVKDHARDKSLLAGASSDPAAVTLSEYKYFRVKAEESAERVASFRSILAEKNGIVTSIEKNLAFLESKKSALKKTLEKTQNNVLDFPVK